MFRKAPIDDPCCKKTALTQKRLHQKFQCVAEAKGTKCTTERKLRKKVSLTNNSNVAILQNSPNISRFYQCAMSTEEYASTDTTTLSQRSSLLSCYECHSNDSLNNEYTPFKSIQANAILSHKAQDDVVGIATPDVILFMSKELMLMHSKFFRQKILKSRNNTIITMGAMNPLALSRAFMWMKDGSCQLSIWDIESLTRLSRHLQIEQLFLLCLNFIEFSITHASNELIGNAILSQDDILLLQYYLHNATFYPDRCCAVVHYLCCLISGWEQLPRSMAINSKLLTVYQQQPPMMYPNVVPFVSKRKLKITWLSEESTNSHTLVSENPVMEQTVVKDVDTSHMTQADSPNRSSSSTRNYSSLVRSFLNKLQARRLKLESDLNPNSIRYQNETYNLKNEKVTDVISNEKKPTTRKQVSMTTPNKSKNHDVKSRTQYPRKNSPAPSVVSVIPKRKPKTVLQFV